MNYKRFEKFLNFDLFVSCLALLILIVLTFGAVVMRYFINRPIIWGEEVQLFCIVFMVFFGAGAGFRAGAHVAIDFLVDLFPPKAQKTVETVIWLCSIAILCYFTVQSAGFVGQMFRTRRTSEILDIPYFITYAAFPIGCILMILNYIFSTIVRLTGKGEEK
jgi:TRAP-type C4-dicarboxylate transport system permease small subunit